jgi:hypothetical protein
MHAKLFISAALALGISAMAAWAQPAGVVVSPMGPFPIEYLVLESSVHADLKVTEDQAARLDEWSKSFAKTRTDLRKQNGVSGANLAKKGLSQEDVDRIRQTQSETTRAAFTQLGEILRKGQVDRLKQIEIQNQGLRAFANADVATALKLTDEQKSQLKKIEIEFNGEQSSFAGELRGNTRDREKMREIRAKVEKLQKTFVEKFVDTFTVEQKKTWRSLVGKPIEIVPLKE